MSLLPNLDEMTDNEKMAVLESIQKSIAESKEIQKQKIAANVDLVVQALKKIETDIRSRFDDVGNSIEKRVSTIKDGRDGINGKDGRDGKDGRNGRDGAKGDKGERGQDGIDGINGVDGVSVTNANIDFDGSLIITLSSGIQLNVGEVVASDLVERIKVITNGGGTAQFVLDTLTSLQTQINNLIPSQTGNSGKYLTTNGSALSWGSISGGLNYQGTWNASTNTPTLTSSVGVNGYYYITATAGSTNLDGITDWQIGDWLMFNGSVWQKIDQSNLVTSVNGYTGTVVLTQTDVSGTASLTTTQTLTNKTLTSPIINEILDANGNEILGLSTTASATDFLTVKNGIGVGVPLHVYADGSSSNIGLHIQPKGTGLVTISDGTDFNKGIRFRSSSSSASAVTLIDAVSTAGRVVTLPDATDTLVGRATADTLTNKTLTSPTLTTPVLGTPASGNLANCTFPTLNQNTTGSAATLTTPRAIYGNNFDGSAALTQVIASTYGGTGNGFTKFTGATTAEKTYTLPDASSTIVVQGGALGTPSSGTVTNLTGTASININGTVGATTASSGAFTTLSATGVTTVQGGSAGAPAITTTGDTNTGIFFPAADTIAFSEGGVEAMRIDSSGNVGIGTSSPQSKLHINSGAGSTQFRMGTNSTSSDRALISYNSTTNRFTIDMSGNDSVIVDGSGNVGLGVTPPTSTDAGNITIKGGSTLNFSTASGNMASNATFNSGWKYIATAAAVKYTQSGAEHQWFNAASGTAGNAITFTQAMTLGSDAKLSTNAAQSGDSGASSATRTLLQQQTSGTQATAGVFTVYGIIHPSVYNVTLDSSTGSGAAAPMLFATGNTERARIDSSGNLLVGASGTANGKVHINGSVVYTVPATFSASIGANAAWTTGYGSQAINLSLWASSGIGGVSVYNVSDRRLKEQITQLTGTQALSFIEKTKPVQFVWKEEQTTDTGFIAQDILAAGFGHLVSMIPDNAVQEEIDENGNVSPAGSRFVMKYDSVIPILTAAIKEQQAIIQTLTDRITALEKA